MVKVPVGYTVGTLIEEEAMSRMEDFQAEAKQAAIEYNARTDLEHWVAVIEAIFAKDWSDSKTAQTARQRRAGAIRSATHALLQESGPPPDNVRLIIRATHHDPQDGIGSAEYETAPVHAHLDLIQKLTKTGKYKNWTYSGWVVVGAEPLSEMAKFVMTEERVKE
jgi:hypothetical protein